MGIALHAAGRTHVGRVRKNNEDQFLIAELTKTLRVRQTSLGGPDFGTGFPPRAVGHLLLVADGMGGVAGGEVASGLAVEAVARYVGRTLPWFYRYQDGREAELEAELVRAVEACQEAVAGDEAAARFPRMATTLTLAFVLWPRVYVVHAGDSRCYLRRGPHLVRMTTDHTVAQQAVERGLLTAAEASASPLSNTLWNYIGGANRHLSPEVYRATLQSGDELLLCTDGLTRDLSDQAVADVLGRSESAERAADALVAAANEAGGRDNVTVVVARLSPTGGGEAAP